MDPTTNPTPTPTPTPTPVPTPEPIPTPQPTPAAPVAPTIPAEPPIPEPAEAPIYQPGQAAAMQSPAISATDPITMPEPAPEPDPVEEALKQPIRPADPVPGSIGSAVSMPPMEPAPVTTPNVSFDSPAPAPVAKPNKNSKTTVILLVMLAGIVIIGLAIFLVMQLMDIQSTNNTPTPPEEPTTEEEEEEKPVVLSVSCKRTPDAAELAGLGNAKSGEEFFNADYGDEELTSIERGWSLVYENSAIAKDNLAQLKTSYTNDFQSLGLTADPFVSQYTELDGSIKITHAADAEAIDEQNAQLFGIVADEQQSIDISKASMVKNYEALGFTCNES